MHHRLSPDMISKLETPCLVIDMDQTRKNIENMQKAVSSQGCKLRPHIKTHKMVDIARLQMECGASGICCSKVSEAEIMANGGCDDIFIAYPIIGYPRIRKALELSHRVKRLILSIDSEEGADMLERAAAIDDSIIEVRLEIDTGLGRTGVPVQKAIGLAEKICRMSHLRLTGIYTFKGLVIDGQPTDDNEAAARDEALIMNSVAMEMKNRGIHIDDISAGSTPTGIQAASTGLVTEVRPGTYVFKDYMIVKENAGSFDDISIRFYSTVVSTNHKNYAVIDGGSKCFPTDVVPFKPPYYYPGYAVIEDRPDLSLSRLYEEHGIIESAEGDTGLSVGQVITLIPNHVCTAINLQNWVYFYENGTLSKHIVDARGMLR